MIAKTFSHKSSWCPDRSTSKGAAAYHDAVVNTSWHITNIEELLRIFSSKVKNKQILVDFGTGTGASAIYFLKELKKDFQLWLVDNSPSWLGKAYDILYHKKNVDFFLLKKAEDRYQTLDEVIGKENAHHVISANTVHLIPDIERTFKGVYTALKSNGTFIFQSGNIIKKNRKEGLMMIDDSVMKVHDIALTIIRTNDKFKRYRKDLDKQVQLTLPQRKLVFPEPRPVEYYTQMLESVGFKDIEVSYKRIKVHYSDWLNFLRVRRLQAGILPEVGGKDASVEAEQERDKLITLAAKKLFNELFRKNPFADSISFTAEWTYISAQK